MILKYVLAASMLTLKLLGADHYEEDTDLLTRGPYEFQFRVDDPETFNKYEIQETGDPDIVRGSYRINLPDGRTQVVNYEVHPERGYEAKITYEGEAQYPDTPGYVPTPYGPPEPLRPGYDKFKRESVLLGDDVGNDEQVREVRKVEIQYSNNGHHGRKHKKLEPQATSELLVAEPSQINVQNENEKSSQSVKEAKNLHKKYDPAAEKKGVNEDKVKKEAIVQETEDDFYDTEHSPQAEPLSLQQNNPPKINKKKEVRIEYKPESLKKSDKDILKIEKQQDVVYVPLIYEAVPTPSLNLDIDNGRKTEENLLDDIYTDFNLDADKKSGNANAEILTDPESVQVDVVSHRSRDILSDAAGSSSNPVYSQSTDSSENAPVTGIQIELISPPDVESDHLTGFAIATQNYRQKNHQKRKINIKDYDKVIAADPYKYILKQEYPTLYRSQTNLHQNQFQTSYPEDNEVHETKNIFDLITGEEYEQLYQTIFDEPRSVAKSPILRKVRIPKNFQEPQYHPVHTASGVKLVNSDVGFVPAH